MGRHGGRVDRHGPSWTVSQKGTSRERPSPNYSLVSVRKRRVFVQRKPTVTDLAITLLSPRCHYNPGLLKTCSFSRLRQYPGWPYVMLPPSLIRIPPHRRIVSPFLHTLSVLKEDGWVRFSRRAIGRGKVHGRRL